MATPSRFSRYRFCTASDDPQDGMFSLSDRLPFVYRELADNRRHVVVEGETWWTLAGRYYAAMPYPPELWWVIADFQPDPVYDPTLALVAGAELIVPSLRTVQELILSDARRDEAA